MKKLFASLAVAAATVTATAAVVAPTAADAQPRWEGPRYWHGPARGPGYHSWRHGYYGRYNRYPVRNCTFRHGTRVCYYR